jgi:type I restriction enzyme S subunit
MSGDWPEFPIEELKASSRNAIAMGPFGSNIKAENFVEVGVPVIKGGNLTGDFIVEYKFDFLTKEKADELKASNAFRRDIVITHRGTIGQVGIIPDNSKFERYVVSQSQLKVTLDQEKVNPYFVYYFLRSPVGQHRLLMNASQVGVPAIAKASTSVKAIMVPCPEKEIQDKIVKIILDLDHKIHNNRQINQILESMAQTIFKSWFVDFEPVKAKIAAIKAGEDAGGVTRAAMRAISGQTDEELDQMQAGQPENYAQLKTIAELFPAAMHDSELGEVPEGWEISTIGDEVEVVGGGTPSTKNPKFWDGGEIHWTTPKDLSNLSDKVLLTTDRKITDAGLKEISSRLLPINTVLMSSRAPVGYLALAKVPVAVNQGYIAMLCDKRLSPEFVIQWCNSMMDEIKQRSSGTTFAEISKKNFKGIPLIVPIEGIQQSYSELASGLYNKIAETASECKILADIRDSLLPKLLSGELSVDAIEITNEQGG